MFVCLLVFPCLWLNDGGGGDGTSDGWIASGVALLNAGVSQW